MAAMAKCKLCNQSIGMFEKKFAGHKGETLCRPCALKQQKQKLAQRLEYISRQVEAFPKNYEPVRDLDRENRLAQLLLASDQPIVAGKSRELKKLHGKYETASPSEIMFHRESILDAARKLIEQLKTA